MSSKWLTKYQMKGLQDGEYYNVRNKKVYVKDSQDNFVLTYSDFELEKVQDYNTNQLMFFFDEIEREWCKTNELHSMTDLLEINRELTIREMNQWCLHV